MPNPKVMILLKNKNLTVQLNERINALIFSWSGFTPSEVFMDGTVQSLEIIRKHLKIKRLILNVKDHSFVMHEDILASLKYLVEFLRVVPNNYKMALVPPTDLLARSSVDWFITALQNNLKSRIVVKDCKTMKGAISWLTSPKFKLNLNLNFSSIFRVPKQKKELTLSI